MVVISDLHSGHLVGLTPPSRHAKLAKSASTAAQKLEAVRQELWALYAKAIGSLPPVDVLIVNGDMIDGSGQKSGGVECLTTDVQEQADMAAEAIKFVKAKKVYGTYGTPYHTGVCTDWERSVFQNVEQSQYTEEVHLKSHLYLDIDGVLFDCKHKVGSSAIPHGRRTALERERLWAVLWAEAGVQPKANVFIRSHVHFAGYCGGHDYLCLTTPALQGLGSRYGARQCTGLVDWGITVFTVENGAYRWEYIIPKKANSAQKVEVLTA